MAESLAPLARLKIREGSKSFSLASIFFDKATMRSAHLLYAWCRYCDDQIDDAPSLCEGRRRLETLRNLTRDALEGRLSASAPFAFQALAWVASTYAIPREYCLDLLDGMEMDLTQTRYRDLEELKTYCYRVAGTVGLMMAHIMGLSDARALDQAVDLGIAMQLTNIARDVPDDYHKGRIYLPEQWLESEGLDPGRLLAQDEKEKLVRVVRRLLSEAENYYVSGDTGLHALPCRAAIAVAAAREIYAGIGEKVRARGSRAWEKRCYLTRFEKALKSLKGLLRIARLLPRRLVHPWRKTQIQGVWRLS